MKLREENDQTQERIHEAQKAVDAMCALKGTLRDAHGVPEQLVADVQRKHRELVALRRRWWYDRQERESTMRRTLAGANLMAEAGGPPHRDSGLYDRLRSSMTLA
eukprot:2133346-Amphidinium_carterae.2